MSVLEIVKNIFTAVIAAAVHSRQAVFQKGKIFVVHLIKMRIQLGAESRQIAQIVILHTKTYLVEEVESNNDNQNNSKC